MEPHYDVVGRALIETLSIALERAFTDDVKAAWLEIWGVIRGTMIEGADYPPTTV